MTYNHSVIDMTHSGISWTFFQWWLPNRSSSQTSKTCKLVFGRAIIQPIPVTPAFKVMPFILHDLPSLLWTNDDSKHPSLVNFNEKYPMHVPGLFWKYKVKETSSFHPYLWSLPWKTPSMTLFTFSVLEFLLWNNNDGNTKVNKEKKETKTHQIDHFIVLLFIFSSPASTINYDMGQFVIHSTKIQMDKIHQRV